MRTTSGWAALAVLAAAGCGAGAGEPRAGADAAAGQAADEAACRIVRRDVLLDEAVRETSGAALDPGDGETLWTHNDSGHEPEVFAVGPDGRMRGRVAVEGARNQDWEDMAAGPCPGGACLFLFDTGDSRRKRRDPVALYRFPVPAPGAGRTAAAERFEARFPGGHRDTEAGFVLPDGSVYLINKGHEDPIDLWRWPTPLAEGPVELERIRTLAPEPDQPGDRVTGAAATPDGRWVAVRSYGRLALYRTADLLGGGEAAFTTDLAPLGEPQGEAVAIADDGAVVLTSESGSGAFPPRMTRLECALPAS